jgi:hypothetical protein
MFLLSVVTYCTVLYFFNIIFHLNSKTTHKTAGIRNWVYPGYSIKGVSCYMHVVPPVRVWASAMYFSIRGVEEVRWPASSLPMEDHPILHGSQHAAKCLIRAVLRLLSSALKLRNCSPCFVVPQNWPSGLVSIKFSCAGPVWVCMSTCRS